MQWLDTHSGRIAAAAALVALGSLLGGGMVWARTSADQITACVDRTGFLKQGSSCGGGQVLTWNTEGPAGPKGDKGERGEAGLQGAPGRAAELSPEEKSLLELGSKGVAPAAKAPLTKLKLPELSIGDGGGPWAFSAWHDQPVSVGKSWKTLAALAVPKGKYVIFAKAHLAGGGAQCSLVAYPDSDTSFAYGIAAMALNVAHTFSAEQGGQIRFMCVTSTQGSVGLIKITAIRVTKLVSGYSPSY